MAKGWRKLIFNEAWCVYFQFNEEQKMTKCLLCKGQKTFYGEQKQNLKRHFCYKHPIEANQLDVNITHYRSSSEAVPQAKKKWNGKLSRAEYIKHCVILAVLSLSSFLLFNSPAFRALTFVHTTAVGMVINASNIGHYISKTADSIRKTIQTEI